MTTYSKSELFTRSNNIEFTTVAFGCSHTWGVGVEEQESWSYRLQARNFGQNACSVDFIVRNALGILEQLNTNTVYVLWPDWARFEVVKNTSAPACMALFLLIRLSTNPLT